MYSLKQLADFLGIAFQGDANQTFERIGSVEHISPNSLIYVESEEAFTKACDQNASGILCSTAHKAPGFNLLQVENPFVALTQLASLFQPVTQHAKTTIHPSSAVDDDAVLEEGVYIGPQVIVAKGARIGQGSRLLGQIYIGENVEIGPNCLIHPQVSLYANTILGARAIVHSGAVVGSDGFGYRLQNGAHTKFPHMGRVRIEDDVEIGANTAIDRAPFDETIIGHGSKIDNLVQIGHGVKLGAHNILCAFTGIAGSTTLGQYVVCAGAVGIGDHTEIGDNVAIGARSGIPPRKTLKGNTEYFGSPARPKEKAFEIELASSRIPSMRRQLFKLAERIEALEAKLDVKEQE